MNTQCIVANKIRARWYAASHLIVTPPHVHGQEWVDHVRAVKDSEPRETYEILEELRTHIRSCKECGENNG